MKQAAISLGLVILMATPVHAGTVIRDNYGDPQMVVDLDSTTAIYEKHDCTKHNDPCRGAGEMLGKSAIVHIRTPSNTWGWGVALFTDCGEHPRYYFGHSEGAAEHVHDGTVLAEAVTMICAQQVDADTNIAKSKAMMAESKRKMCSEPGAKPADCK
jgi:hypothetical protein